MLIRGPVRANDPHTSHLRSRTAATALAKVAVVGGLCFVVVTEPWRALLVVAACYLASLPLGSVAYQMLLTDAHGG